MGNFFHFLRLFTMMAPILLLVQCGKPKEPITIRVTACSGSTSRTEITNPQDTWGRLEVVWSEGDKLHVFSPSIGYLGSLDLLSGAGSNQATFEGTLQPFTTQDLHFYYLGKLGNTYTAEDFAMNEMTFSLEHQENFTLDDIENNLHLAYGTARISPHQGENGPDFPLQMDSKIAICMFNSSPLIGDVTVSGTNIFTKINVDFIRALFEPEDDRAIYLGDAGKEKYFVMAPSTGVNFTFTDGTTSYNYTDRNISAGVFYSTCGIGVNPPGTISHDFSVSSTRKVRFTSGNLVYSDGRWYIHDKQYHKCADFSGNLLVGPYETFDMFPWGASGCDYMPWTFEEQGEYGPSDDSLASINNTDYDWGVYLTGHNSAARGIYVNSTTTTEKLKGSWRTLTADEWRYVLQRKRPSDSLNLCWCGTLETSFDEITDWIDGTFIMPDDYTGYLPNDMMYPYNMTERQLAASGGVFLPCTGYYEHGAVVYNQPQVWQWTTTRYNKNNAYAVFLNLKFEDFTIPVVPDPGVIMGGPWLWWGMPVRLAQDVSN